MKCMCIPVSKDNILNYFKDICSELFNSVDGIDNLFEMKKKKLENNTN